MSYRAASTALRAFSSLGANPIGAAATGFILQTAGLASMVWLLSLGTALLALAATLTPSIRTVPLATAV